MSKEIDELYKQYSARIMELDDTPLFASGTFGTFKILSVEEYEEMQKQIATLQKQLSDSEAQNKRVLEKLELIVRSNQELEKALELACQEYDLYLAEKEAQKQKISLEDYFKEQAQKELKSEQRTKM